MKNLYKWLFINNLCLNTEKTKYIIIYPRQRTYDTIGTLTDMKLPKSKEIEKKNQYDFLEYTLMDT